MPAPETVGSQPGSDDTVAAAPPTSVAPEQDGSPYERIVVSDQAILDAALALDLPVAAIPGFSDRETLPAYLGDLTDGIEVLPDRETINLEQLAAFEPDLLLFNDKTVEASGAEAQLREIADLAALDVVTTRPWRDSLHDIAAAAGVPERAEQRIAEADDRLAEAAASLTDEQRALEVSVVRCFGDQCRYLPGGSSFSGMVLDELGVARPELQASDPEGRAFVNVSPEQFDLLGGDVIVLFGTDADDALGALEANPLWQGLDAVQNGRVVEVDPQPWFTGNVIAAEFIASDIVEILSSLS
jgi:iron complex transport system substrate-binding protein